MIELTSTAMVACSPSLQRLRSCAPGAQLARQVLEQIADGAQPERLQRAGGLARAALQRLASARWPRPADRRAEHLLGSARAGERGQAARRSIGRAALSGRLAVVRLHRQPMMMRAAVADARADAGWPYSAESSHQ